MSIGRRIASQRAARNLTQAQLAERLGLSFQAVSSWEREETLPDLAKIPLIAKALETTAAFLMGEPLEAPTWDQKDRLFHEDRMYTFVKAAATAKGFEQTLRALPFARARHQGQLRKGKAESLYQPSPDHVLPGAGFGAGGGCAAGSHPAA